MQKKVLYSNVIGSYLFDERMNLIKEEGFADSISRAARLSQGELLEEEKKLASDMQDTLYLGFKKEKFIAATQDIAKLSAISDRFKPALPMIRNAILFITKRKVRDSTKNDLLIMQASGDIDELSKSINLNAKRLREWYELYNPEPSRSIPDHTAFVKALLSREKPELLREIGLRPEQSMGADFQQEDVAPILSLAKAVESLIRLRDEQTRYLESLMKHECPNITAVAGAVIGAKLISRAGGLQDLAMLPASKLQLLGAEKALFRHLRNKKSLPPKYGLIHEHPLIARAARRDHGRIARTLADKIAIAARVDYFKGEFVGERLRKELDDKQ